MAKIKINAEIYSGDEKLPTITEVEDMIENKINEINNSKIEITESELDTIIENAYNEIFGN